MIFRPGRRSVHALLRRGPCVRARLLNATCIVYSAYCARGRRARSRRAGLRGAGLRSTGYRVRIGGYDRFVC